MCVTSIAVVVIAPVVQLVTKNSEGELQDNPILSEVVTIFLDQQPVGIMHGIKSVDCYQTGCFNCQRPARHVVCCKHFTSDLSTFPWQGNTTNTGNIIHLSP